MKTNIELGQSVMNALDRRGMQHGYYSVLEDGYICVDLNRDRLYVCQIQDEWRELVIPQEFEKIAWDQAYFCTGDMDQVEPMFPDHMLMIPTWADYIVSRRFGVFS